MKPILDKLPNGKFRKQFALYPDEKKYLLENFYQLTNAELHAHINKSRSKSEQMTFSGFRHQFSAMGLKRGVQIRWSQTDTKRLKKWYTLMGDVEIAEYLNKIGCSRRRIYKKMVYKKFVKKMICKKRQLLDLIRTPEMLERINENNQLRSNCRSFTKDDNVWTRAINRKALKEGEVVIRKHNDGHIKRFIKIDGKMTPYGRWYYINFVGPVPPGVFVHRVDFDYLNDEPENFFLKDKTRRPIIHYETAIKKHKKKMESLLVSAKAVGSRTRQEEHETEARRLGVVVARLEEYITSKAPKVDTRLEDAQQFI